MEVNGGRLILDLLLALIFLAVQWRIALLVLRRVRLLTGWRRPAALVATALAAGLVAVGYACSYSEVTAQFRMAQNAAAILGAATLCYLLTSTAGLAVASVLCPIRRRLNADADPGRRRVLNLAGNALMVSPFAAVAYGALVQRTNFQVEEVDVPLAGLPADLDGLRILQLSDIHLGVFLSERELARVIDASCELRPHIAFATGDFISTFGDPLEVCIRQLARVKTDAGMWGCLGNHERFARAENRATELAARAGIPILRGEARQLRFGKAVLNVAGVDYQSLYLKEEYLAGAERLVYPGAVNLLLSHNPDVFPVAAAQGYDLTLAGHTHGGQVTVEILDQGINPARFFTPYVKGLYRLGPAANYVTRGIGTIGIPARIGAPPEITLLRLRKA
jgi:predicted MPP superfamily phosphohydrolase